VTGTPYLAGAGAGLDTGLTVLMAATGWSLPEAIATCTLNPARLLGGEAPAIERGRPTGVVRFALEAGRFRLIETIVDGLSYPATQGDERPGMR
jgi:N-acetylglucosamine-6-phosphate deacetylase